MDWVSRVGENEESGMTPRFLTGAVKRLLCPRLGNPEGREEMGYVAIFEYVEFNNPMKDSRGKCQVTSIKLNTLIKETYKGKN